jgi:hypothetical protein
MTFERPRTLASKSTEPSGSDDTLRNNAATLREVLAYVVGSAGYKLNVSGYKTDGFYPL